MTVASRLQEVGIPGGITASADADISLTYDSGAQVSYEGVGDGMIEKCESLLAKLTIKNASEVEMCARPELAIEFGKGVPCVQGRHVIPTLSFILQRVEEIIRKF